MTQKSISSNKKLQGAIGATALPWTALDLAWLDFLKSHQASTNPLHDALALLVSHQMGQGQEHRLHALQQRGRRGEDGQG